ncbi:MAG: hypothetical protein GWN58_18175, partial [Anaerolineae bacterium]|nr:hypothetical protein [Anaerolineae bacterium]
PPPPAGPDSLETIADNFMRRYVRGRVLASADEIERQLRTYVYPRLGRTPINEIKRSDIANLLDEIEDGKVKGQNGKSLGGPVMADRVLATLRKLFNWHSTRDDDFVSPVAMGMARTIPSERRRERVMSDQEIRAM